MGVYDGGVRVDENLKWELFRILTNYPNVDGEKLERLLAKGEAGTMFATLNIAPLGDDAARDAMQAALDELALSSNIQRTRQNLHQCIADALKRIQMAERDIKKLDEMGDAEYENGSADLEAFLADAARSLRAAQVLKPTNGQGE
jgi:hypothetical protein